MSKAFTRQLGYQSGVQLNPLQDGTDGFDAGNFDQVAAVIGRFNRGRIDKPFFVDRNNFALKLGKAESISISALNECRVQMYEALQNGAIRLLTQRLSVVAAAISWAVVSNVTNVTTFAASLTAPTTGFLFGIKHLGCYNDGLKIYVHADTKLVTGTPAANDFIRVRITDALGAEMFDFSGSLDPASKDEFGQSNYIGDVATLYTDELEFTVFAGASIPVLSDAYGKDSAGKDKWGSTATPLVCFTEGGTGYANTDYDAAIDKLKNSTEDYGYIMSGGTRAVTLIAKLGDLAYDTNRQFVYDIPSEYTPSAAITFQAQLGWGTTGKDHYPQAYWCPVKANDPLNGGKSFIGTGGVQIGLRCARNANTNSYGLAAKHRPIAGAAYSLGRVGANQIITPTENELSDLAAAKINPVLFQSYNGGSKVVFVDSLTCASTVVSYRKLISVAETSSHLSEMFARYARELLQLPMTEMIKKMDNFAGKTLQYALDSEWAVQPADGSKPFTFLSTPNAVRPADRMDFSFSYHPNGVGRQVFITPKIY